MRPVGNNRLRENLISPTEQASKTSYSPAFKEIGFPLTIISIRL